MQSQHFVKLNMLWKAPLCIFDLNCCFKWLWNTFAWTWVSSKANLTWECHCTANHWLWRALESALWKLLPICIGRCFSGSICLLSQFVIIQPAQTRSWLVGRWQTMLPNLLLPGTLDHESLLNQGHTKTPEWCLLLMFQCCVRWHAAHFYLTKEFCSYSHFSPPGGTQMFPPSSQH